MVTFNLGTDYLDIKKLFQILDNKLEIQITDHVRKKIEKSQKNIANMIANDQIVYGVNTGFGDLCNQIISKKDISTLQSNLLKSHAVGVDESMPDDIVRLMLISKAHCLALGYSGVDIKTIERILWHLKENIIPVVPKKGSVGASGDLAPLSHLFLPLIGLGEVSVKGKKISTADFFKQRKIKPLELGPKEGLALINGTQFIVAYASYGLYRFYNILEQADIIAATTLDATLASLKPFDSRVHELRPFAGNKLVAERISSLLKDSKIRSSNQNFKRIQDPYSLRCIPQIHGASRNAWLHLKQLVETELNSVTDNPIILNQKEVISCGNFHGQPLAIAIDYATIAASELGNVADRRCYLMLEGSKYSLPIFLMNNTGINSGFMIPQYTTAALVSENKSLCYPASADSIPTSLGQEDHVSMGSISARKFNEVLTNLEYIQAIELMYAAQALEFRRPLKSSPIIEELVKMVRKIVEFKKSDTVLYYDIKNLYQLISSFKIQKLGKNLNQKYQEFDL